MTISAERLYLRELSTNDAIHFFNINNDPECIKYTGDVPFGSVEVAERFLETNIQQYRKHKMGRWAVCLNDTNAFLGWCGLKYHPKDDLVDLGYRFYREHWRYGYATEAAKACLNYGFNDLELERIVAHVHIHNLASHRVLLRSGMIYLKDFVYEGQPAKLYQLKKNEYLTSN